ncbi:hypothetical protein GV829_10220 [Sphingomonas lacunae]|uniref:Oligosaccharide flippase family protein n=1 Tax=Sphingomonas lacunae TaxID=2698828 RepID=A0A6M4B0A5_9SPHN|nr:hypothetical protein [Sphingomonas lacunae]QJQ32771.1 hypothetical protein GV829_10220 [Sphingomonas lacunae]
MKGMNAVRGLVNASFERLVSLAGSGSGMFLIITLASNGIFILRSYAALAFMDYRQLGLMAIVQTLVLLIGTLQFGLLNGGYRVLCSADKETTQRLNNLAYTLIGLLTLAVFMFSPLLVGDSLPGSYGWIIAMGVTAGSLTLLRTWINNQLIATHRLTQVNQLTIWSGLASLLPLLMVRDYPLESSLLSFVLQPALFVIVALIWFDDLRPKSFSLDLSLFKQVMKTGILIFLSGVLLQVNVQIERFYVVRFIGVEALGHLYISILFVSLFTIIPNALQSIFVPRIVRQYESGEGIGVNASMASILLYSIIYCLAGAVGLYAFGDLVVSLLSPKYAADLYYVKLLYPGIALFTVASSLAIVCNITLRYWPYIAAFGLGSLATGLAFGYAVAAPLTLDLAQVTMVKTSAYLLTGAGLWIGYLHIAGQMPQLRLRLVRPKPGRRGE